ncbi:hypothetical protein niasHT_010836 [Heterodera trifolii]|uniref:Uncharacterized protein n=1 Tax=Heterodera trifolii TaxID=157864 RepID=A0ABD2KVD7_9BILA
MNAISRQFQYHLASHWLRAAFAGRVHWTMKGQIQSLHSVWTKSVGDIRSTNFGSTSLMRGKPFWLNDGNAVTIGGLGRGERQSKIGPIRDVHQRIGTKISFTMKKLWKEKCPFGGEIERLWWHNGQEEGRKNGRRQAKGRPDWETESRQMKTKRGEEDGGDTEEAGNKAGVCGDRRRRQKVPNMDIGE